VSGLLKKSAQLGLKVTDRFSPRLVAIVTYTEKATQEIKCVSFLNPTFETSEGGVFVRITHSQGMLMIEAQHLHAYEEKKWNRADYTDDLEGAPEADEDGPAPPRHSALLTGRW